MVGTVCGATSSSVSRNARSYLTPDSMGYAFTLPFVRLVAGGDIAIGSYTHYPTVSSDMVKRVRERVAGVENGGASKSALRTWAKLV